MASNLVLLLLFMLFELITASSGTCGKAFEVRGIIIGGNRLQTVQRNDFPWISALIDSKNSYFCGGVLISKTRILTAAHCIQPKFSKTSLLPRDLRILLGAFDLGDPYEVGRLSVAVEEIRMHPNWNPSTTRYEGDIAVLQMEDPVIFNKFIQPICLISPDSNMLSIESGTVIGYGLSSKDATSAESIPNALNVPIHKNDDCFLDNPTFASISSKNTFCAGYANGSKGVCFGDSGSGLYIRHERIQYLRGIVSASLIDSDRACDVNDYAVFCQVSNYYEWITNGDEFLQSLSVQRIVTKAVEVTTVKTVSRFDLAAEPEEKQHFEVKYRNDENLMKYNIDELDYEIDVRRK